MTNDVALLTSTGYADHLAIMEQKRVLVTGTLMGLSTSGDPRVQAYLRPELLQ